MADEIEFKYLVDKDKAHAFLEQQPDNLKIESVVIKQAYLATSDDFTVRARVYNDSDAEICAKSNCPGAKRKEYEYRIPVEEALQIFEDCQYSVHKIRYTLYLHGKTWFLDKFLGALTGQFLLEFESNSIHDKPSPTAVPSFATTEVTDDPRYRNHNLARHGFPKNYSDNASIVACTA